MSVTDYRLKPIKYTWWGEWYRGMIGIVYDFKSGKGRDIEVYAVRCRCEQFWGWTPILEQAVQFRDLMAKVGCPKCRKKTKPRR